MSPIKLVALIMLVALMLESGLMVNRAHLAAVLKNYQLLARALLANFILVPLCAVILVRAFHLSDFIAVGIYLMAIAPGVPFLARAAGSKSGGSLAFALALCFIMPVVSIVTVPFTAHLIFPLRTQAYVPVGSTLITLVIFELLPLIAGMAINERAPQLAEKLLRPLAAVVGIAIVVVLVLVAPTLIKAVATIYGSNGTITAAVIALLSLGIGWFLGGPSVPDRNTLAIATVLRNIGVAFVIATVDFEGTPVAAMVASYFLAQIVIATIAGRVFARNKPALAT